MRLLLLTIGLLGLLLTACTNQGLPLDDKGREDFLVFHEKFYADSLFQLQRIEFPLAGTDPDGVEERFYWDIDNWRYLQPLEEGQDVRKLPFVDMETWMIERLVIQERFGMEKQFTLMDNKWYLTSYSGIAPIN